MKFLTVLGATAALLVAAWPARSDDPAAAFAEAWQRAEQLHADAESQAYALRARAGNLWRDGGALRAVDAPGDKAMRECVTALIPTPSPVRLLFALDRQGNVTRASTDQTGYIAECLERKIVGGRMPAPPADGFLLCHRYEKLDADHWTMATCGPRPIVEACEQRGNSTTCRIERR